MTGQVHQDVDVVLADPLGGLRVGEPDQRSPAVGIALEASRDRIGLRDVGVAEDLEAMMVVVGDDRLQEGNDRVLAEVGRDVADCRRRPGGDRVGRGSIAPAGGSACCCA